MLDEALKGLVLSCCIYISYFSYFIPCHVQSEKVYHDNILQDYKIHRDEIHTKLVQIMRERLLANLRKLPQIVEDWNKEDVDPQPSAFAKSVTKVPFSLMFSFSLLYNIFSFKKLPISFSSD